MTNLAWESLQEISASEVTVPNESQCYLPEKILQFGTGVLLRGLPDYYVDQANRRNVFQGRIVAVKSTSNGPLQAFDQQNGLYTLIVRGDNHGKPLEENTIISSISRVLFTSSDWEKVLVCAASSDISIIISNTTEVGIRLTRESIHQQPPKSFPAKLLACLYRRYEVLGGTPENELVIIPTELIIDNGMVLRDIVYDLAEYNVLGSGFLAWLKRCVFFCNSLVDRIVPGRPEEENISRFEKKLNYHDELLITAEPYNLWAIEGDERIAQILTFGQSNRGMIITPDINLYREIKLRLLNGTHTICCGIAFLAGLESVYDATAHSVLSHFIRQLMFDEIALAIPYSIPKNMAYEFAHKTFERFCNPYIRHSWLKITSQYTMKLKERVVPVLLKYYELYHAVPERIAFGFAAYLLFMKAVRTREDRFFAENNGKTYPVDDSHAAYFYQSWKQYGDTPNELADTVLKNKELWDSDLTALPGFASAVKENLHDILLHGILNEPSNSIKEI